MLDALANPLATVEQLASSASGLDGISSDLERSLRFRAALLTQSAGILLRLPQDVVARAIITLARFYVGPEGGSFAVHSLLDFSAAALYLTAKLSFHPQPPRAITNVYNYLESRDPWQSKDAKPERSTLLSDEIYLARRKSLFHAEALILRSISYTSRSVLPHPLALSYLRTLSLLSSPSSLSSAGSSAGSLASRTIALLNSALLSPQLLYLTHQPNAIAVASIYLAARQTGIRLGRSRQWWRVWDVDREELGFLVAALASFEAFVRVEKSSWASKQFPLTAEGLTKELAKEDDRRRGSAPSVKGQRSVSLCRKDKSPK